MPLVQVRRAPAPAPSAIASSRNSRLYVTRNARTALTTTDHNIRHRYLHLAKLWHEMAREAERKTNGSSSSDG